MGVTLSIMWCWVVVAAGAGAASAAATAAAGPAGAACAVVLVLSILLSILNGLHSWVFVSLFLLFLSILSPPPAGLIVWV